MFFCVRRKHTLSQTYIMRQLMPCGCHSGWVGGHSAGMCRSELARCAPISDDLVCVLVDHTSKCQHVNPLLTGLQYMRMRDIVETMDCRVCKGVPPPVW